MTVGAEVLHQADMAVEREHAFVQFICLFHNLGVIAKVVLEPVMPSGKACTGADRQG
ncbi:hypothetical protein D3C78_1966880 [compost metagenome]